MSAADLAPHAAPGATRTLPELVAEAQRVLSICNACRYCEGYCAVFPALQRRLAFEEGDVQYLANLCHNCGACYHACQYAPPHEFALNFPRLMAPVRAQSWRRYAWPGFLARAFDSNGLFASLATAAGLAFFLLFAAWLAGPERLFAAHSDAQGSFYAVIPHGAMVAVFGAVSLYVLLALVMGFVRFWADMGEDRLGLSGSAPATDALHDAAVLKSTSPPCTPVPRSTPTAARWCTTRAPPR